jgi:L-aspartate oxidase
MSRGAGVVRTETGLGETLLALQALEDLKGPAPEILAARFIARAALERRESRGGHHRADWPREGAPRRTRLTLEAVTPREPCA